MSAVAIDYFGVLYTEGVDYNLSVANQKVQKRT